MSENHKETIKLLEKKLDEANAEWDGYNNKIEKLIRHTRDAERYKNEIADTINTLKQSILDLKKLGKVKSKKGKK